ncbi:MAG: PEP-CTERM sorting domain-containing protein [Gammaproteobacteria bacterium]|nr:PEP-CTERM sorting domain-containing protein [Gammaproteobacteria bacterium]
MDATFTTIVGIDVADAVDIVGDAALVEGTVTGDFAAEGITAGDSAVYNDFVFDPFATVAPLWTIGSFSFDLTSISVDFQNAASLVLSGFGWVSSTTAGLDTSYASWKFTANGGGSNFNFSTSNNVPEPAIVGMFGLSLLGLALVRRRRQA